MKKPVHPGAILKEVIVDALGLSVTAAAAGLGVSRKQLSAILNEHAGISPEMSIRLERGVGSTAEHWLRLQAAFDLAIARARAQSLKIKKLEHA